MKNIWIDDSIENMNIKVDFKLCFEKPNGTVTINVSCADVFRININGHFIGYGPRRILENVSAINTYDITSMLNESSLNELLIELISYKNDGYYLPIEDAFFSCDVLKDGKVIYDSMDFKAYRDYRKLRKVVRYSLQRNFTESYNYSNDYISVPTKKVKGNILQGVDLPYPSLEDAVPKLIECGQIKLLDNYEKFKLPFVFDLTKYMLQYKEEEYEDDAVRDISRIEFYRDNNYFKNVDFYKTYEFEYAMTGFISVDIDVKKDTNLYLIFDETLNEELFRFSKEIYNKYYHNDALPIYFYRLNTVNVVKFKLQKGVYNLKTVEPYTLKYLRLIVNGEATINNVSLSKYADLKKIYIASQRTFAQNSLDFLIDCPSRERAAWLCDTYFSSRAEKALTGSNRIEKNTLNAFLNMPKNESLPDGIIPMCYFVNPYQKLYFSTWSMWFVIELEDYLLRTKDKEFVNKFKEKIDNLFKFLDDKYLNECGLLENLNETLFIEWSKANDFRDGVNFPANMLYFKALMSAYNIFNDEHYLSKATNIKEQIVKLAYDGEFFVDNAIRINGELTRSNNISETCQYYAFFTGIADESEYPELFNTLLNKFGKYRDASIVYPNVYKSNSFIGNILRLEILANKGYIEQTIKECKNYLLLMAERTGTLWEHDTPIGSLVHCFQSMAAKWIEDYYLCKDK